MIFLWCVTFCLHVLLVGASDCDGPDPYENLNDIVSRSDLVIAGYTKAVFKSVSTAEFLVFNTFKGDGVLSQLLKERELSALESALSRRLVNVTGLNCGEVRVGETYILFLNVVGQDARNTVGTLMVYSRDKEDAIRAVLGGLGMWDNWSSCSKPCGRGMQERKRKCEINNQMCSTEDGQERVCNSFPCAGLFDILDVLKLAQVGIKSSDKPSAFYLDGQKSWTSNSLTSLHRAFPLEFGLLLTLRPIKSGFVFRITVADTLTFGLSISNNNITLILSDTAKAEFDFHLPRNSSWLTLAFSVRRNNITFYYNCKLEKSTVVTAKLRPLFSQHAAIVMGPWSTETSNSFEGDIEQLIITESPTAASQQCSLNVRPLMHLDSPSPSRGSEYISANNNMFVDEDEIEDDEDEDFAFRDVGSGLSGGDKLIPLISEDDEHYVDSSNSDDDDVEQIFPGYGNDDWDGLLDDEDESVDDYTLEKNGIADIEGSGTNDIDAVEWSDWSPCSHTCGWGTRSRTSFCSDNSLGSTACISAASSQQETETCFLGVCSTISSTTLSTTTSEQPTTTSTTTTTTEAPCLLECKNGGVCNRYHSSCQCLPGYYGKLCEHAICIPNCLNNGACSSPNQCLCQNGYTGKQCQRGEPEELSAQRVVKMEDDALLQANVHVHLVILGNNVKHLIAIPPVIMAAIV